MQTQADDRKSLAILGTRGIPAQYGGFETFAEELAIRLAALGVDVTVYCACTTPTSSRTYKGVQLEYVCTRSTGGIGTIWYDVKSLWKARKKHDVVMMLGYGAAWACIIPRLFGSAVWINPDGMEWQRSKWGTAAQLYLKLMESISTLTSNRLIADAETIANYYRTKYSRCKTKVSYIAYGATLPENNANGDAALQHYKLTKDSYYLIVCRIEPENHVSELIAGFLLSKTARRLVVVGNHLHPTRYTAHVRSLTTDAILFVGVDFDRQRLSSLRTNAFAYLHGHSVGGTNPSLLEAMACSNAVLAHDNLFNREVARDSALFFKTPTDAAQRIQQLEDDAALRTLIRERAKQRVTKRYTWDAVAQEYNRLLAPPSDA